MNSILISNNYLDIPDVIFSINNKDQPRDNKSLQLLFSYFQSLSWYQNGPALLVLQLSTIILRCCHHCRRPPSAAQPFCHWNNSVSSPQGSPNLLVFVSILVSPISALVERLLSPLILCLHHRLPCFTVDTG